MYMLLWLREKPPRGEAAGDENGFPMRSMGAEGKWENGHGNSSKNSSSSSTSVILAMYCPELRASWAAGTGVKHTPSLESVVQV